jgi:hypothetical protein
MAILDGIADAVVKLDGTFVAMNQAAASIYQRLGLNFQDMKLGKSVWELFPELKVTPRRTGFAFSSRRPCPSQI